MLEIDNISSRNLFRRKKPSQPLVAVALCFVLGIWVDGYIDGMTNGGVSLWIYLILILGLLALFLITKLRVLTLLFVVVCGGMIASLSDEPQPQYNTSHEISEANRWCQGRIERLGLNKESESIVRAMSLGDRRGMDRETTQSYRRSGGAHILATSGLHVGIFALLLALLLRPLTLLFYGNLLQLLLGIAGIWIYAYIVGLTPSITRAAIIFTLLSLSYLSRRRYSALNILSGTMLAMVALNPPIIYNVGFQLSFAAIFSILLWALPIWRRFGDDDDPITRLILLPLLIGLSCSIAVMPILSHTFGYIATWGVLINPILLLSAYLILALSFIWILFGFDLLAPIFRTLIERIVALQNGSIRWASEGWREGIDYQMGSLSMALIYMIYAILTYLAHRRGVIKSL